MGIEKKPTLFKMRQAPAKPKRGSKTFASTAATGKSYAVDDIIKNLEAAVRRNTVGIKGYESITEDWMIANLDKIYILYSYYGGVNCKLTVKESNEEFAKKMDVYKTSVEEYLEWRKQNSLQIEIYEKAEKDKKLKKEQAAKERARMAAKKDKEKLEKLIEITKIKLNKIAAAAA